MAAGIYNILQIRINLIDSIPLRYYFSCILAKKESAMEKQLKEEEKILESIAEKKALMGVAELAKGIQYEDPIKTR